MARPAREIDLEAARKMAWAQCRNGTIGKNLGWQAKHFIERVNNDKELSEFLDQKRSQGKADLRIAQMEEAVEEANPTMLVWLGKQYLDQTDKKEVKSETTFEDKTKETKSMKEWEELFREMDKQREGVEIEKD